MIANNWNKIKIVDLIEKQIDNRGKNPPKYYKKEKYPVLDNYLIKNEKTPNLKNANRYIDDYTYNSFLRNYIEKGDVVITLVGAGIGNVTTIPTNKCVIIQNTLGLRCNEKMINDFLYYTLLYNNERIKKFDRGSSQPSVKKTDILNMEVLVPTIKEQKAIVNILLSLDRKIEINNKINETLENISQNLYKRWFIDFKFPDEERKPYSTNNGKMIDSELGMIPEGWKVIKQGKFFPVITGKKNANIATSGGKFKFFTCSQKPFLTDEYSFDAEAILVAGNGDFNVKYFKGKFEAYQRTYVLIPYEKQLTGLLYFSIKNNLAKITSGHRGSVIKFITKGDLENYKLALPNDGELMKYAEVFSLIVTKILNNETENEKLIKIRDILLPKLMSGEIKVPIEE